MTNSESGFMFRKWHLIPFSILLLITILLSPFILYCLNINSLPLSKDAPSHFSDYIILSQAYDSDMVSGYDLKTRKRLQYKNLRHFVENDRILGFGENYLVKMTNNAGEPNKLVIYNYLSKSKKILNIDCKYASPCGFTTDQEGFYFTNHNTLKHYSMKSGYAVKYSKMVILAGVRHSP